MEIIKQEKKRQSNLVIGLILVFLSIKSLKLVDIKRFFIRLLNVILAFPLKLQMLNMYTSCYTLPLKNYVDIISEKDLSKYKKFSFIPVSSLCIQMASIKIYNHSIELSKNTKIKNIEEIGDNLRKLDEKVSILTLIQQIIQYKVVCGEKQKVDDVCLIYLKKHFYKAKDYEQALSSINNALKILSVKRKQYVSDLDKINKDEPASKGTTKADMIWQIQSLYEMGLNITMESSTADYIITLNRLDERTKKQLQKQKNGRI